MSTNQTNLHLHSKIAKHFNIGELTTLCHDIDIMYENLGGKTRADKARELELYVQRQNNLILSHKLIQYLEKKRPKVNWDQDESVSVKHGPPPESDATPTARTWNNIDTSILKDYLMSCSKHDPTFSSTLEVTREKDETGQEHEIVAINDNEAKKCLERFNLLVEQDVLTRAGALLFCKAGDLGKLNTDVLIFDERTEARGTRKTVGRISIYAAYSDIRQYFIDKGLTSKNEQGYIAYPEKALEEAIANILIHRDYEIDDVSRIEIKDDCITFMSPGESKIEEATIRAKLRVNEKLNPKKSELRNPNLVEALGKTGISQFQGGGLIRIKQALITNGSYCRSDGTIGELDFESAKGRFVLTIYKRDVSKQDESLQEELTSAYSQIKQLQEKQADYELQLINIQRLEKEKGDLLHQKDKLEEKLINVEREKTDVQQKLLEIRNAASDLDKKTKDEEELTKIRVQLTAVNNEKVIIQEKLFKSEVSVNDLEDENRTLKRNLKQINQTLRETRDILRKTEAEYKSLKKQFDEDREHLNNTTRKNEQLNQQVNELTAKSTENSQTIQALENSVRAKDKFIQDLQQQIEELAQQKENQAHNFRSRNNSLIKQINELEEEEHQRKTLLDQAKKDQESLEITLQTQQDIIRESRKQISNLHAEIHLLTQSLSKYKWIASGVSGLLIFSAIFFTFIWFTKIQQPTSGPPLQFELGVIEDSPPTCNTDGTWSVALKMHSEGGLPPITYLWKSTVITTTQTSLANDIIFNLDQSNQSLDSQSEIASENVGSARNDAPIEGTGVVISSDGQIQAKNFRIEAPNCP